MHRDEETKPQPPRSIEGDAVLENHKRCGWGSVLAAVTLFATLLLTVPAAPAAAAPGERVSVIVRHDAGTGAETEALVRRLGGRVERRLGIIGGLSATVPAGAVAWLRASRLVHSVTQNQPVQLNTIGGFDSKNYSPTTMYWVAQEVTGAGEYWGAGWTGKGVDVALLDTGVVEVEGLRSGKVVYGPDLSYEADNPDLRHKDTYGHGTHMAGIIAGRDSGSYVVHKGDEDHFLGMAPGARVVSVKLADASGATDVSQVIAGIDWVVQNRNRNGLNIRVLNLSFGTDGVQSYLLDPLTYAAEVAWRKGIVVVVSAGNEGFGSTKLNNPAYDPHVLAVGGADGAGTYDYQDDTIQSWSSRGDGTRNPDLVAPGASIVSLRDPGSTIDTDYPTARVATRFFKGTGTSQAAAVVSGAAALVLQQRPTITPNQVKKLLTNGAQRLWRADPVAQGRGMLDLKFVRDQPTPTTLAATQLFPFATGLGSLEASRGSLHTENQAGASLVGEQDAFGGAWDGRRWSEQAWTGLTWAGGTWSGTAFSGGTWNGQVWSGRRWSSGTWTGRRWSGSSWTAGTWTGRRWSGSAWAGRRWSGGGWM
jgi:subtilisin family serine protease